MFDFRIIETPDGNQIIDRSLKTPYNALTPLQMLEYTEMDARLSFMDRIERKAKEQAARRKNLENNPLRKIAFMCGLVRHIS